MLLILSSYFYVTHLQVSSSFEYQNSFWEIQLLFLDNSFSYPVSSSRKSKLQTHKIKGFVRGPHVYEVIDKILHKSVVLNRKVTVWKKKYICHTLVADACFGLFLLSFSFIFAFTNVSSINLPLTSELREGFFRHGLPV